MIYIPPPSLPTVLIEELETRNGEVSFGEKKFIHRLQKRRSAGTVYEGSDVADLNP
jgi:hypothetical protein